MSTPPLRLRPYSIGPVRAQTAAEAGSFDARAIDEVGVPQAVLMENAGRSAALVAHALLGGSRVVALVGAGNNGADALVALRSLVSWGYDGDAVLVADRSRHDPLLHGWAVPLHVDEALDDGALAGLIESADLVLDGILGTGARGAPRPRQARVIDLVNGTDTPVVAIDVPSGIDATSGSVPGSAVDAAITVSFGAPKTGALFHPARALVGRHVTTEIGFPPLGEDDASAVLVTPRWAAAHRPVRGTDTHKNRVGRVLVVGGGVGMAGAVILAGRAAFRTGAGLVQVASVPENREIVQAAMPEAIFVDVDDHAALAESLERAQAVAVGPGLGTDEASGDVMRRALGYGRAPMLLDADALNLAAGGVFDLRRLAGERSVLITPHPGEMSRLLGARGGGADGPTDRLAAVDGPLGVARRASVRFGCTVLYKGAPSVVASSTGPLAIDTQSSSDLAVAGMGDTLTGVCVALMAQGLDAASSGALGLYLSGRAAHLAGRGVGLTPSDVVGRISDVLSEAWRPETELRLPFVLYDADPAR